MKKFVRPALCRLCKCPAGSDGVRLSDVDIVKLSRWWGKALETEFEDEELEKKFFCQICLWDAKFQGELKGSDGCDWWAGHDTNELYKKFYYQDAVLRPCAVALPALNLPQDSQGEFTGGSGVRVRTECIYCAAAFKSRTAAYRHALDSHKDTVKFSCRTCFLLFSSDREKKLHIKVFHAAHHILCHTCKRYVKSHLLLSHISKNHFSNDCVECCGKIFEDPESLCDHFKLIRMYNGAVCVYCNKICASSSGLVRHIKIFHSDVAVKCNYSKCCKFFLSKDEMQRHVKEVHENKPGTVLCLYCECKISKENLSRHVLAFHHSQAIRCTFKKCCTYFNTELESKEHERQVHLRTSLRLPLNCSQCGKSMCERDHLKKHFRRMHQSEPMFCKIYGCREYFLSEPELERHFLEKHAANEAKKPFKCNECSFASLHKSTLVSHVRNKHTATGNCKCSTCGRIFKSKYVLASHIAATHAEPKKCVHCGEAQRFLHNHLRVTPCRKCKYVAPCAGLRKLHKSRQCNNQT